MKKLLLMASFIFSGIFAHADLNLKFDCLVESKRKTLIITDHKVYFLNMTFTNMLPVSEDAGLPYRSYAFINDPWYDVSIPTKMLSGTAGYINLLIAEPRRGRSSSTSYSCNIIN